MKTTFDTVTQVLFGLGILWLGFGLGAITYAEKKKHQGIAIAFGTTGLILILIGIWWNDNHS